MPWDNNRPTHVPTNVRHACLTRDNHQCTATMRDGTRCTETTNLEAAHLPTHPWHPGQTVTPEILRTLCHWHHNRETQAEAAHAKAARKPPSPYHPHERHPGLR